MQRTCISTQVSACIENRFTGVLDSKYHFVICRGDPFLTIAISEAISDRSWTVLSCMILEKAFYIYIYIYTYSISTFSPPNNKISTQNFNYLSNTSINFSIACKVIKMNKLRILIWMRKLKNSLRACNEIEFVLLKWLFYHSYFKISIKFNELLCTGTEWTVKRFIRKISLSCIFHFVLITTIFVC